MCKCVLSPRAARSRRDAMRRRKCKKYAPFSHGTGYQVVVAVRLRARARAAEAGCCGCKLVSRFISLAPLSCVRALSQRAHRDEFATRKQHV